METIKSLRQALSSLPGLTTRLDFSEVELTPEELEDAIYQAKAKKWGIEDNKKKEAELIARANEAKRPWRAAEMMEHFQAAANKLVKLKGRDNQFITDDSNRSLIYNLCNYFSGDAGIYKPERGMFIMGGVGTGKTTIMQAFSRNKKQCYRMASAIDMAEHVKHHGAESWKIFLKGSASAGLESNFYQPYCGWLIDDMGTEDIVNDFGNKVDVIANIVFAMSNDPARYGGSFHFTTNLNKEMLEHRYGPRVMSRLRELCNVVALTGEDRRK